MRRTSRSRSAIACAALGLSLAGGCAAVFGLEEPTVRDGAGGATSSGTTAETQSGITVSSGGPGSGGGGSAPTGGTGGDASSSTGAGGCKAAAECDDENPCNEDECDDGECVHPPVVDGPLGLDGLDCRNIACLDGQVVDEPDDTEDPADTNAPCTTTICEGGEPRDIYADEGTSCGSAPQVCDGEGLCIGCDPQGEDVECGAPTDCASPFCTDEETCDPGYVAGGTLVTDDVDGDCTARECTGASAAPAAVVDDTDLPPDYPCGAGACDDGIPTFTTVAYGQPCIDTPGFCDGTGVDATNCKVCIDDTSNNEPDIGCSLDLPYCHEELADGVCGNCVNDNTCDNDPAGRSCEDGMCGCSFGSDCNDSPAGEYCGPAGQCGCQNVSHCGGAGDSWGELCINGVCGCNNDSDCDGAGENCDTVTHQCE